jgi:hypothetical protein
MVLQDLGPSNDQMITLGYFDPGPTTEPADFQRGNLRAGVIFVDGPRFMLVINGNRSGPIFVPGGFDEETHRTDPFEIDLTLDFNENLGENGEAFFTGSVAGVPINEFTFSNAIDAGDPLAAFGIGQSELREQQDAWRRAVAWIDDVTYSVVTDAGPDLAAPPRIGPPAGGEFPDGDYNQDNFVNAADYAVWRDMLDETGADLAADGNGDMVVDALDYDLWKINYGDSAGLARSAAIPEPASWLMMMLAAASLAVGAPSRGAP